MNLNFSRYDRPRADGKLTAFILRREYAAWLRRWPAAFYFLTLLPLIVGLDSALAVGLPATSFVANVTAIVDGVTCRLEDGRAVRLSHLEPPHETDAARISATRLADKILGKKIRIDVADPPLDRHGRVRAIRLTEIADGADHLAAMIGEGWLAVYPEPGASADRMARYLMLEGQARRAATGHWRNGTLETVRANPYSGTTDKLQTVLGRVKRTNRIGNRLHLEFGSDWRRDFTVGLEGAARKAWNAAIMDGGDARLVRIRGWVRWWNGPFMELSEPSALEILD